MKRFLTFAARPTFGPALVAAIVLATLHADAGASVVLQLTGPGGQAPQAAPGTSTTVCLQMLNSNDQVAGVQTDLAWDSSCLSANLRSGGGPQCRSNPATGKTVQSAMRGGSSLRAIMLSVADVNPIPDGELFCCEFTVDSFAAAPQCAIKMSNVIAATPTGQRAAVSPRDAVVYVLGAGTEGTAPAAGGSAPRLPAAGTTGGGAGLESAPVAGGGVADGTGSPAGAPAPVAGLPPRTGGEADLGVPPAAPAIARRPEAPSAPADELAAAEAAAPSADVVPPLGTTAERTPAAPAPTGTPDSDSARVPTNTPAPVATPTSPPPPPTSTPGVPTPTTGPVNTPTPASGFFGGCAMRR